MGDEKLAGIPETAGDSTVKIFPGGAPDAEVAAIMHDLSRMQTWAVMLAARQTPGAREAMDLVQRTRCLIVERLYPNARAHAEESSNVQ